MSKHWVMVAAALAASVSFAAQAAQIVEFDPPGQLTSTPVHPLDAKGNFVGAYFDNVQGKTYGYIRKASGQFKSIQLNGQYTAFRATAPNGVVTGSNFDGTDFPGLVGNPKTNEFAFFYVDGIQPAPQAVNARGDVTGVYLKDDVVERGFVRRADGTIEKIDIAHAGPNGIIFPQAINKHGDVSGWWEDEDFREGIFLRLANGKLVDVKLPNQSKAAGAIHGASAIDSKGTVGGSYTDKSGVVHGYLRDRDGNATIIDAANAKATVVRGLNDDGVAAGTVTDQAGIHHGFVRAADGTITTFDAPDAAQASPNGTFVLDINAAGVIGGYYITGDGNRHMYVRTP